MPSKAIEPFLTARFRLCRMVAGLTSGSIVAISSGARGRDDATRTAMIRLSSIADLKFAIFDKAAQNFDHVIEGTFRFGQTLKRISFDTMPDTSARGHDRHRLPGCYDPEPMTNETDSVCVAVSGLDFDRGRVKRKGGGCVGFDHFLTSLCVVTPCDNYVVS